MDPSCRRGPLISSVENFSRNSRTFVSSVSQAKEMDFYRGLDHVDYDLLKTVQEFVRGFEVEQAPLWQWEEAILQGYRVFRTLRDNNGGKVTMDMFSRELRYQE